MQSFHHQIVDFLLKSIRQLAGLALVTLLLLTPVFGQRDAPVWDSYLAKINLLKERESLDFDISFVKSGGPGEHTEHQMYILGYLEKDEARILELAADKRFTNKTLKDSKLLFDILEEEKLAVNLSTQVAKREQVESSVRKKPQPPVRAGYFFNYSFSLVNQSLLKSVSQLKHFDAKNSRVAGDYKYYDDKFKLMIFVPVNDCKYATKVLEELRKTHDFAHSMDTETILLYFKPLPYRFQFRPSLTEESIAIYVD